MVLNIDTSKLQDGDKVQCPRCAANGNDNSKDNFHWYNEQQGGYCWACKFTIPSKEYVDLGKKGGADATTILQKDIDSLANKSLTQEQIDTIHKNTVESISVKYRGLNSEVCKRLGVRWEIDKDGKVEAMYFPVIIRDNGEDKLVGYKVRRIPKEFFTLGYVGKLAGFFNKKDSVAKKLLVVSGELDLITAIFALENSDKYRKDYNIVSPTTGEGSIANTIKLNYDWVDAHEQIIICTDMDDAGDESFEAVKAVVDNSKLFRAKLRHKDLNDYLKNGDGDKIANDLYWSPVPVSTFGIANSGDIFKEMLATVALERVKLPPFLSDLDEVFNGGISLNEIISLVAPPSGGKTAVINQWILDWLMTSPYKVFVIPFEDSMASYGMKIASKVCGVNIQALRTAEERLAVIEKNKDEINKYLYNDDMTHRFNIMETIPSDIEDLKKSILQAIKVNGSQIIVIDPLSALLSKMSNEQQVDFMAFQESLKREYAVTIINCLHVRKSGSGQAANSEGASYSEEDIRGSSSISGTATINILLNRNKMAECDIERNTTTISVSKNRTNGNTGRNLAKIYYSPEHSTLFSYSYAEKNGFFKGVTAEGLKKILDEEKATTVLDDSFKREVDESMDVF